MWNSLLEISGTGNCESGSSDAQDDEYYKACIKKDIEEYRDWEDFWNNSYWQTWYEGKLANSTDKEKFQKLGSWEKFREVCTKGYDDLIKGNRWSELSSAVSIQSSIEFGQNDLKVSVEDCGFNLKEKYKNTISSK